MLISPISRWALKPTYYKASIKHGPSLEVQVPPQQTPDTS